jgi:hypothetical protein
MDEHLANGAMNNPTVKRPERRLSRLADRRMSHVVGQSCTEYGWSAPPPLIACDACSGTADLLAYLTEGTRSMVRYRCRGCGHEFDRMAES